MSAISKCPACGKDGRWGFDDDWCHGTLEDALACDREGLTTDEIADRTADAAPQGQL